MILRVFEKPPKNVKPFIDKTIEVPDPVYKGKTKKLSVKLWPHYNELGQVVKLEYEINTKKFIKQCPRGITLATWFDFEMDVEKATGSVKEKEDGKKVQVREGLSKKSKVVPNMRKETGKGKEPATRPVAKLKKQRKAKG